ncbi:Fungal specific transcription factor [Saitoella coloradoensis]
MERTVVGIVGKLELSVFILRVRRGDLTKDTLRQLRTYVFYPMRDDDDNLYDEQRLSRIESMLESALADETLSQRPPSSPSRSQSSRASSPDYTSRPPHKRRRTSRTGPSNNTTAGDLPHPRYFSSYTASLAPTPPANAPNAYLDFPFSHLPPRALSPPPVPASHLDASAVRAGNDPRLRCIQVDDSSGIETSDTSVPLTLDPSSRISLGGGAWLRKSFPSTQLQGPREEEVGSTSGWAALKLLASEAEGGEWVPYALSKQLLGIFMIHVHPVFPVLNKQAYLSMHYRANPPVPRCLSLAVYLAGSLFCQDPLVCGVGGDQNQNKEDAPFSPERIWEKLDERLREDTLAEGAPTLSFLQALCLARILQDDWADDEQQSSPTLGAGKSSNALLDWTRRGTALKIAFAFNLHRSPTSFRLSPSEKRHRRRLWWCLYTLEIWDAAIRGRPPSVRDGMFDVEPVDDMGDVDDVADREQATGHEFFVHTVGLTRILARVLALGYTDSSATKTKTKTEKSSRFAGEVQELRFWLGEWYRELPGYFRCGEGEAGKEGRDFLMQTYACALEIGYHTVSLLLHRAVLRRNGGGKGREGEVGLRSPSSPRRGDREGGHERQDVALEALLLRNATAIVMAATSVPDQSLKGFPWRLCQLGLTLAGTLFVEQITTAPQHPSESFAMVSRGTYYLSRLTQTWDRERATGPATRRNRRGNAERKVKGLMHVSGVALESNGNMFGPAPAQAYVDRENAIPLPHEDPTFVLSSVVEMGNAAGGGGAHSERFGSVSEGSRWGRSSQQGGYAAQGAHAAPPPLGRQASGLLMGNLPAPGPLSHAPQHQHQHQQYQHQQSLPPVSHALPNIMDPLSGPPTLPPPMRSTSPFSNSSSNGYNTRTNSGAGQSHGYGRSASVGMMPGHGQPGHGQHTGYDQHQQYRTLPQPPTFPPPPPPLSASSTTGSQTGHGGYSHGGYTQAAAPPPLPPSYRQTTYDGYTQSSTLPPPRTSAIRDQGYPPPPPPPPPPQTHGQGQSGWAGQNGTVGGRY